MKRVRWSVAGYAGGLMLGLGVVLVYGAMEVSSTPAFCGSCHVMSPYYESWKSSSHAQIACVDCHIPPGVTAELEKKFEALSMVTSYVTGTYGTNPWAEVDDEACLECHERRLLGGLEMFGDILFDHRPHLTELRQGKRLRCTSCHSQIVQGSHITVTSSTCILCHFKNQTPNVGTARCTLCHQTPQGIVDRAGVEFDHGDVVRFGMDCQACHVAGGGDEGRVPRERCLVCHNDPTRLAEFAATQRLHQLHVTDRKVECTNCHLEIQHVVPHHLEPAQTGCQTCHGGRHSPQRNLYAGLGGKGVAPRPDVMYQAQVRCEGCHFDHGDGGTATAGEVSCMSCHGPEFRKIYRLWTSTLAERTAALRRQVDGSTRSLGNGDSAAPLANAVANLELVERGNGIHNFGYSLALLDAAHRQLNEARAAGGLGELPAPWPTAPFASSCLNCHAGVESKRVRAFGRDFPHEPHVVGRGLGCTDCHTTHEERDQGAGPLKIGAGDCGSCHHGDAGRDCLDCHGGVLDRTFATDLGDFAHSFHVLDMELACTRCHGEPPALSARANREVCADCH